MSYYDERHDGYEQMLDECYEPWKIGGMTYYPSEIFYSVDPIAYRVGLSDYLDSLCQDGEHDEVTDGTCDNCGETIVDNEEE